MIQYTPDSFQFNQQSLRDFTTYLRGTGWQRIKYHNDRLAVYAKEIYTEESPAIIALPANVNFSDFSARMIEAVQRLAEVEETSPDDIYQKIQAVGQDCIRLRLLLSPEALPSLELTSRFLQGARDLVVYAACMEQEVRRYFAQPFHIGKEQAEQYQFDHTFQGSFGFTIKAPLPTFGQLFLPGTGIPLERRVVERITRGLQSIKNAEEMHNSEEISKRFDIGLNGNMCKAVINMLEEMSDIPIEYSVRWSLSLSPSSDVARIAPIVLDREAPYYLRDAAKYLERAATTNIEKDKTIEGPVISLSFENQSERVVTLLADGYGKVSFTLEAKDYANACDAHRDGLIVNVSGTLRRKTKRGLWTLLSPHNFHVKE